MSIPHRFSDHQHCMKCGKGEWMPDGDDCTLNDEEFDVLRRRGECPQWTYKNGPIEVIYTANGPVKV